MAFDLLTIFSICICELRCREWHVDSVGPGLRRRPRLEGEVAGREGGPMPNALGHIDENNLQSTGMGRMCVPKMCGENKIEECLAMGGAGQVLNMERFYRKMMDGCVCFFGLKNVCLLRHFATLCDVTRHFATLQK